MFVAWQKDYFERVIKGLDSAIYTSRRIIRDTDCSLGERARYRLLEDSRETLARLGLMPNGDKTGGSPSESAPLEGCYWPLYFDGNENNNFDLDICAICFGGLIYASSLRDKALEEGKTDPISSDPVVGQVLRTLVATRIEGETGRESEGASLKGSWPHYIDLTVVGREWANGRRGGISPMPEKKYPTVNQTTLALSTFVRLGFFETGDRDLLRERVEYVRESVGWLLSARNSNSSSNLWSQTIQVNGAKGISTVQTAYVYNTFRLLHGELEARLACSCGKGDQARQPIIELIGDIKTVLKDIEGYYSTLQLVHGANASYEENPSPDNVSFLASCHLIDAFSKGDLSEGSSCLGIVRELYRYILGKDKPRHGKAAKRNAPSGKGSALQLDRRKLYEDYSGNLNYGECFEPIDISDGTRVIAKSHFELSPYSIIPLAYLKLLGVNDGRGLGVGHIEAIRNRVVFKHRINDRIKRLEARLEYRPVGVYVRGARGVGSEFPIYAIYNARNMLNDMRVDARHRYIIWSDVLKPLGYSILALVLAALAFCMGGSMQSFDAGDFLRNIGLGHFEGSPLHACIEGLKQFGFPVVFGLASSAVASLFVRAYRAFANVRKTRSAAKSFVPSEKRQ